MRAFNRVEEDGGGGQATMEEMESGGMPGYLCAASAAGEGCCYKPDTRSSSLTSTATPASTTTSIKFTCASVTLMLSL